MFSKEELARYNKRGLVIGPAESIDSFKRRALSMSPKEPIPLPLYGAAPDYIEFTDEKVPFWQGGYAEGHRVTLSKRVNKNELLQHEAVHVLRSHFEEPQFEEYFAYQTSKHWYRRFFGPMLKSNIDVGFFVAASALALLHLGPLLLTLAFFLIRRLIDGYYIKRAIKVLKPLTPHPLHLLVRMTDREIRHCNPALLKSTGYRWQQIKASASL